MKHRVLFSSLFAIAPIALMAGCASKSDAEVVADLKSTLAESCKASSAKSTSHMTPDAIAKYCECSADKTTTMLGAARIRAIADGESMSASDQETLKQAGSNCAVEMLTNMLTDTPAPKP